MHYEVELRWAGRRDERTGAAWRPFRRVEPDGAMSPLTFDRLGAAQAYVRHMDRQEVRIVAVDRDGRRQVVDADGT